MSGVEQQLVGLDDVSRVFLSFPEVLDDDRHRDYNHWHQFDHLPQNLALPGVRHGQRWVRTPACRAASTAPGEGTDPRAVEMDASQYVAMYWFAAPARESVADWLRLGSLTDEIGRRPETAWTRRRFTGFATPVASAAAEGVLVTAGAVPHLPHAGIVVDVVPEPADGPGAGRAAVADLARVPSVLGAYAFSGLGEAAGLQVRVAWCSEDPVDVVGRWPDGATFLRTPLAAVVPGEWDWFDR